MINRRRFLQVAGTGAFGLLAGALMPSLSHAGAVKQANAAFRPDLDIALGATPEQIPILPGRPTAVWRFRGQVIHGDPGRLVDIPGSYLGPIIRAKKGDKIRIRFTNDIPDETIVHWHGLHVPALMDGHPRLVIPRGGGLHLRV